MVEYQKVEETMQLKLQRSEFESGYQQERNVVGTVGESLRTEEVPETEMVEEDDNYVIEEIGDTGWCAIN